MHSPACPPDPANDPFPARMRGSDIMAPYRQERHRPWYIIAKQLRSFKGELDKYWQDQMRNKASVDAIRDTYAHRYWEEYRPYYIAKVGRLLEAIPLLRQNHKETIEYVLGFLEAKPYFEHSQYHYAHLKRAMRKVSFQGAQEARWQALLQRDEELAIRRRKECGY